MALAVRFLPSCRDDRRFRASARPRGPYPSWGEEARWKQGGKAVDGTGGLGSAAWRSILSSIRRLLAVSAAHSVLAVGGRAVPWYPREPGCAPHALTRATVGRFVTLVRADLTQIGSSVGQVRQPRRQPSGTGFGFPQNSVR